MPLASLSPLRRLKNSRPRLDKSSTGSGNFRLSILKVLNLRFELVRIRFHAGTEAADCSREDIPETFDNKEALIEALPSYDDPYIKVPRVLNKE
ncbi:glutamyl-tRNA(Gln) amidotransferase subunit C, chloroplastic/mitochondrial isoform X2 [Typha latifolia]|uniref:glutamyl-tRNA(Gln) amidotransferase subunit C, chloroplastic/mitochondrial isoform X2 n=1 Tax=Typha latifolia TaxID=4733 RepID=UPI003C2F18DE